MADGRHLGKIEKTSYLSRGLIDFVSGPKFTMFRGHDVDVLLFNVCVSSPRHAFSGNSTQLQSVYNLSSVYTDYSFSRWHTVKGKSQNCRVIGGLAQPQCQKRTVGVRLTWGLSRGGGALHCFCPRALKTLVTPL